MAQVSKKTETRETEEVETQVDPNNPSEFQSHIKDGPSQDDLNPAYAPTEDDSEAAQAARKLAEDESGGKKAKDSKDDDSSKKSS